MTNQSSEDTTGGAVVVGQHDIIPFNAILDCVNAIHLGQDVAAVIAGVPADRVDELFVYALSLTYGAIKLVCLFLNVTVEEFLSERDEWFAKMGVSE